MTDQHDRTPEDDQYASERRAAAYAAAAELNCVSDEEKAAFADYCATERVKRKRIRKGLAEVFLGEYRNNALARRRAAQVAAFLAQHRDRAESENLTITGERFEWHHKRSIAYRGVDLTIDAAASLGFGEVDVDLEALDSPEAAAEFAKTLRETLELKAEAAVVVAETALKQLIDGVLDPGVAAWLEGEERVRKTLLSFAERHTAEELTTLAERRLAEALGEAVRNKARTVAKRLAKLPDARLRAKTLHNRYRELLQFLSGTLAVDLVVEKVLNREELDQLAASSDDVLAKNVDAVLEAARTGLLSRTHEQVKGLEKKIATLPHVELLRDEEIIRTVAPYYTGLDRALKKRRARHALVAVEEKAREAKYQDDVGRLEEHKADYADVAKYYPLARALNRKLVLYVGPTNSGKTWRALNALAAGESGNYLAPLRLLALEGQEELEKRGKPCSFLTGEERDLRPDTQFMSSTIEMLDMEREVDAVVIDEVQLLTDERRGWAWLAAFLGAPAKKVIMTGSPDCIGIVTELAAYLGEELEVHECQRFNELRVAEQPIRLRDVTPGTAIVCFSRRDVLRLKETIEANSPLKVAVIYGNLSPQVRREEARRFRSGEAEILVATDAIAMGLNLPIKEVLFYRTDKFDGEEVRELTASEIRQIGGRAGRYGFAKYGVVNALSDRSLALIKAAVHGKQVKLAPPFYVAPGPNHVRIIGKVLGTDSLERILTFFERAMEFSDDRFARSNIDELSFLSSYVDRELPHLPLTERLTVASAPVDVKSDAVLGWFIERMLPAFRAAEDWNSEDQSSLGELFDYAHNFEHDTAASSEELRAAEDYLKTLTVYAWLAYRYPSVFSRLDDCEDKREMVNAFIERSLRREVTKRCVTCDAKLPKDHAHRTCDRCHARSRVRKVKRRALVYEQRRD